MTSEIIKEFLLILNFKNRNNFREIDAQGQGFEPLPNALFSRSCWYSVQGLCKMGKKGLQTHSQTNDKGEDSDDT